MSSNDYDKARADRESDARYDEYLKLKEEFGHIKTPVDLTHTELIDQLEIVSRENLNLRQLNFELTTRVKDMFGRWAMIKVEMDGLKFDVDRFDIIRNR